MLVSEKILKRLIKEEFDAVKKEGYYGRSRFRGGYNKPKRTSETEEARNAIEDAIEQNFRKYYEERKAELESQGKKIKGEEEIRSLVQKEADQWLSGYKYALSGGDEDDRHSNTSEMMPSMPARLRKVLLAGGNNPIIPNFDVRNNMYDGSSDY